MRRPVFAANWKMNKTILEAEEFSELFAQKLEGYKGASEIVILPPFTVLWSVRGCIDSLGLREKIRLGAQNLFWEDFGAYTGEICANMLIDTGCQYVVIGHSERRQYFKENDESVNRKVAAAVKAGLKPIICIGEHKEQRERGETFNVIEGQLRGALDYFEKEDLSEAVIAYEPVWAIGTGLTATPQQAQEAHRFIREKVKNLFGEEFGNKIRIQYGGSVKPSNIADLMAQEDIDGALIGGASLDAGSFFDIISFDRKKEL